MHPRSGDNLFNLIFRHLSSAATLQLKLCILEADYFNIHIIEKFNSLLFQSSLPCLQFFGVWRKNFAWCIVGTCSTSQVVWRIHCGNDPMIGVCRTAVSYCKKLGTSALQKSSFLNPEISGGHSPVICFLLDAWRDPRKKKTTRRSAKNNVRFCVEVSLID